MDTLVLVTNDQKCWKTESCKLDGLTSLWGSVDQELQRFSKGRALYGNKWHRLLSKKKSLFIHRGFSEASLGESFLQELRLGQVQKYLQEENIPHQEKEKLSYDLLRFIKSTYSQDEHGTQHDYIRKLGNLELFPVSQDGQPSYWSFDKVHHVLFPTEEKESVAGKLMQVLGTLKWPVTAVTRRNEYFADTMQNWF